jgi:hypothetical protein
VNSIAGGNSAVGTIDNMGKYTAPASFPSSNTVTITATSQADSSKSANASAIVVFSSDNAQTQAGAIKLGTTGGNSTDLVNNGTTITCCSGTLGSLVVRNGTFFILSNNHVLDKSDRGTAGDPIGQPGLVDNNCAPGVVVANLTQSAALKPASGTTGPAPSNVDAAIAQIVTGKVDTTGSILDLGAQGASSIAAAPPSSTLAVPATVLATAERVAKSGRSSGLTCSTLQSVSTTVSVDYESACGGAKAFTSTFNNQVIVNGGTFSASGDSGSLIVTADTARPVALLYAGNSTSTSANPITDVLNAFQSGANAATIVGGGDHAVSCAPTSSNPGANGGGNTGNSATLSTQELERAAGMKEKYAAELMQDPAVSRVGVGISEDNPKESAVTIFLNGAAERPVPAQLEGVRTKLIYNTGQPPALSLDGINRATTIKDARVRDLMGQEGIMGVGVGRSEDGPGEPALVIYVEQGKLRSSIPPEIDGIRTRIIEGDRFRAFGWGKEPKPTGCSARRSHSKK